jgi:hypothetical protein
LSFGPTIRFKAACNPVRGVRLGQRRIELPSPTKKRAMPDVFRVEAVIVPQPVPQVTARKLEKGHGEFNQVVIVSTSGGTGYLR